MDRAITASSTSVVAIFLAAVLVAGCTTQEAVQPGLAQIDPVPDLNQDVFFGGEQDRYVLRANDKISVTVFREPELSVQEVSVGPDGHLSVPLLGQVDAAGLTVQELERFIQNELGSRFLRDPKVNVSVTAFDSHQVTVEGAVQEPGLYKFLPGTRLSGGLALAKGMKREAEIRDVAVFRQDPRGMEIAKFDLAQIRAGTMGDPMLQPGDRIVVGTDNLTQTWQDLLKAIPVLGLFTRL